MQFNKEQRERLLAMRRQQHEATKSSSLLAVWYSVRAFIKTVLRAARSIVTVYGPVWEANAPSGPSAINLSAGRPLGGVAAGRLVRGLVIRLKSLSHALGLHT